MKMHRALDFIITCICEAEADGYQQMQETHESEEEFALPDKWSRTGKNEITIVFGGETFKVKVTKARKA